jgi:hypothetical protein
VHAGAPLVAAAGGNGRTRNTALVLVHSQRKILSTSWGRLHNTTRTLCYATMLHLAHHPEICSIRHF